MHYKNGRLAKSGDKVIGVSGPSPVAGILHSLQSGSDTCNGRLAQTTANDPYINIKDLIHIDDLTTVPLLPPAEQVAAPPPGGWPEAAPPANPPA